MTTKLRIADRDFDLEDTFQNTKLGVLRHMTKRLGVTLKTITDGLDEIDRRSRLAERDRDAWQARVDSGEADALDPDRPPSDDAVLIGFISTDAGLDVFTGLVWLARAQAGDRHEDGSFLGLDEASDDVGFLDIRFVNDEPDTSGPGEAPGKGEAAAGSLPSPSTTSSETSTPASV